MRGTTELVPHPSPARQECRGALCCGSRRIERPTQDPGCQHRAALLAGRCPRLSPRHLKDGDAHHSSGAPHQRLPWGMKSTSAAKVLPLDWGAGLVTTKPRSVGTSYTEPLGARHGQCWGEGCKQNAYSLDLSPPPPHSCPRESQLGKRLPPFLSQIHVISTSEEEQREAVLTLAFHPLLPFPTDRVRNSCLGSILLHPRDSPWSCPLVYQHLGHTSSPPPVYNPILPLVSVAVLFCLRS
jgi:hypothetical protein